MTKRDVVLEVKDMRVFYGAIEAVKGISFTVGRGEVVTLIGSNGAGKSTTLRAISGLTRARSGSICLEGEEIGKRDPHDIVGLGISQAPEGRHVFAKMSVRENLMMGAYSRRDGDYASDVDNVMTLFPILRERSKQAAGTLSGGEQQMLAIGRALMARPRVLLLDEPSLGVAPLLTERIYDTLRQINEQGTTILLVEQNANMALGLANRGYVIETGSIVLEDTAKALKASPEVRRAYLGED